MQIIHCADLHLDSKMNAHLNSEQAAQRRAELLDTFTRLVDYATAHEVDAILISGDLFDTRRISATARRVVWEAIGGHPDITFFYLQGNHDTEHFFAERETLPENLRLFGDTWVSYPLGAGRVIVSGLELSPENAVGAGDALLLDPAAFNIVMLHGQQAETGARDRAEVIRLRDFQGKGIDYLALGHVHAYQEGALDARGTWCYPGCLEGRGFDECGEHGFVLLDIDESTGAYRRAFVPFATRRLYEVPVDIDGCDGPFEILARIREEMDTARPVSADLVRVLLTGEVDVEDEIDIAYLAKQLEPDYFWVDVRDQTAPRVDAQRFLLDQSLKGEFVRTVMAREDLSEEERAAVIRCGLRAIAGEEVATCD